MYSYINVLIMGSKINILSLLIYQYSQFELYFHITNMHKWAE